MSSSNDLNVFQQVYLQCFAANLGGLAVGNESFLQSALNKAVAALMSGALKSYGWEITWGPRVWKDNPDDKLSGLDNAWFASFAPSVKYPDGTVIDTCVVAIAGTAVFSKHDWPVENFGVDQVVDFDSWIKNWQPTSVPAPTGVQIPPPPPSTPYTAYGTSEGVFQLATNTSPSGNPGENTNIIQYLQTLPANCRIIFTGHSLGGALSPTLPMCLESAGLLGQIQNPQANIITLPAAGATPGEQTFSKGFSGLFPQTGSSGYQIWNADFYNTLDIVPQAWCTKPEASSDRNMQNILTVYGQLEDPLYTQIKTLIDKESAMADSSGVTYIPIQGNAFTGTPPTSPPGNMATFMIQVTKQHTKAYYDQVKVSDIMAELYKQFVDSEGVHRQNLSQAARRYPVLRFIKPEDLPEGAEETYPYDVILGE